MAWVLLTFGQFMSIVGCAGSLLYALSALSQVSMARERAPQTADPSVWIVLGAAAAFFYSAAMFVVFGRAKWLSELDEYHWNEIGRLRQEIDRLRKALQESESREGQQRKTSESDQPGK